MKEENIIHTALANFNKLTGCVAHWKPDLEPEGLTIEIKGKEITFVAEVRQELRLHQMEAVLDKIKTGTPTIIIAKRLFPQIKEYLRANQIAYLEANGNTYINQDEILIRIDGQKPLPDEKIKTTRAFTKAGIRLLFLYLTNKEWLNKPYREVANEAQVALGTIPTVIEALKKLGLLVRIDEKTLILVNKEEIIKRWAIAYAEELKPKLKIGNFMLDMKSMNNWKDVDFIDENTIWGGEPAANILTNYINPIQFTLYTTLNTNDLIMKNYLLPHDNGQVQVYEKFWNFQGDGQKTAPPLIVYADLIATNENRNIETAKMIYDQYLKNI